MKEIYLLSGLGADRRVFGFVDFPGFQVSHIEWVAPLDNEPIESYATRLLGQVKTKRPILVGVSFGGMVAVEIAKQIDTDKVILISSAKTRNDIPSYFRRVGQLRLNKWIPLRMLKAVNWLTYWYFGTKTKQEKELLRTIIKETDNKFLRWAVDKIANWSNTKRLSNLTHIHGTNDRILPLTSADFEIPGGGHLMIVNKGLEISGLICEVIAGQNAMRRP